VTPASLAATVAACQVGDSILVRYVGGRPTKFRVLAIAGKQARELELEGVRGAKRWLVDGGSQVWLRDPTAAKRKGRNESGGHRRVTAVEIVGARRPLPDLAEAQSRLPVGYGIGVTQSGFVALELPVSGGLAIEIGEERANPWHAVCDAWRHSDRVADEEVADLEDRLHEAEADLQRAHSELAHVRAHATKCSLALQQIRELARGVEASGTALAGPSPESVVADVGHALRVESMRNR
jgi:hypothetical protein